MIRQQIVTRYPSVAQAGDDFSNTRATAIYASAVNQDNDVFPGVAQVVVGNYDYTRKDCKNLTAANVAAAQNRVVVAVNCCTVIPTETRTLWYDTTSKKGAGVIVQNEHLRVLTSGDIYVVVEKTINPANAVYVRVANAVITPGLPNGVGFFSDTASPDHVLLPEARWIATDTAAYLATKDAAITPAIERDRMGQTVGYGIAPLELRYSLA